MLLSLWVLFYKITLATQINSLARYSKRTVEHLNALPIYGYQVSGSFRFLSQVLFNFPSLYWFCYRIQGVFRVGSWCLPDSCSVSGEQYSGTCSDPSQLPLRDYHTLRFPIPGKFEFPREGFESSPTTPHLPAISYRDSVCSMLCSLADTNSIFINFFSCRY